MPFYNEWEVFKLNEKSTYPRVSNKVMLVMHTDTFDMIGYRTNFGFVDVNGNPIIFVGRDGKPLDIIYYKKIGYFPKGYDICKYKVCGKSDRNCEFGYEDDGYCLAKFGKNTCPYIRYCKRYIVKD